MFQLGLPVRQAVHAGRTEFRCRHAHLPELPKAASGHRLGLSLRWTRNPTYHALLAATWSSLDRQDPMIFVQFAFGKMMAYSLSSPQPSRVGPTT